MSSLVRVDNKGPFGPAVELIYNGKYYNETGTSELSGLLEVNYEKLAKVKPIGREEFCGLKVKTPVEVIASTFFKSMQKESPYLEKIERMIVPVMLKGVDITETDAKVNAWFARFLASYMTEEQIVKTCDVQAAATAAINAERMAIGTDLYKSGLSENDLNAIITSCRYALTHAPASENLKMIGRYLNLFAMNKEHPEALGKDVLDKLDTLFREKMFPKAPVQKTA